MHVSCLVSEHPGTSKTSLFDLLHLHHEQLLPTENNLPGWYEEAHPFVKPFLLPFVVCDVCPNDCMLFCKTDHYDYSKLTECPSPKCKRGQRKSFIIICLALAGSAFMAMQLLWKYYNLTITI